MSHVDESKGARLILSKGATTVIVVFIHVLGLYKVSVEGCAAIHACCYTMIEVALPVEAKGSRSGDTKKSLLLINLFFLDTSKGHARLKWIVEYRRHTCTGLT